MKLNSLLAKPFAGLVYKGIRKSMMTAVADQEKILQELLKGAKGTEFGKEHSFDKIKTYEEFREAVPVRDYEEFKPYIEKVKEGKQNILWKVQRAKGPKVQSISIQHSFLLLHFPLQAMLEVLIISTETRRLEAFGPLALWTFGP